MAAYKTLVFPVKGNYLEFLKITCQKEPSGFPQYIRRWVEHVSVIARSP